MQENVTIILTYRTKKSVFSLKKIKTVLQKKRLCFNPIMFLDNNCSDAIHNIDFVQPPTLYSAKTK
ncbi:hypothetical protein EO50_26155 [Salmonella enterica]|nr:hypothetical protein [Salmonella enterica subsp. enterica]EBK5908839.1 hypothetical protein [Salmonella enterica]MID23971.1 hypothetical protein [Salmonella enterica]